MRRRYITGTTMIVWNFFQNFTENQSVLDRISVAKCVVTSVMYPEKKISIKKKIRGGSSNIRIIYCYLDRRCVNQHNSSIVIILSTSGDRRV